jgi:hypothetical protein
LAVAVPVSADVVDVDGVPHVRNGAEPRDGIETVRLEELWRAGDEEDDIFFGLITKVDIDAAGNVYVLDAQLSTIQVYGPDGAHLKSLFREGEGPGEISQARDMVLLGDGRVGAAMEFPGKVVFVDADGNPAGFLQPGANDPEAGGFWSLNAGFTGGDVMVLSGTKARQEAGVSYRENFLSLFNDDGQERTRLCQLDNVYDFTDFVFSEGVHIPGFWWNTAVGADGRIFTAPDLERYAIHVFSSDGVIERVIEREYDSRRRSADERQVINDMIDNAMSGTGIPYRVETLENDPDLTYMLRGLRARDDGTLWALNSRGIYDQPDGVLCTFDVFDREGVFAKQVRLQVPGDGRYDAVFFGGGDRAVVVRGYADAFAAQWGSGSRISEGEDDEATVMEVVYYRIVH